MSPATRLLDGWEKLAMQAGRLKPFRWNLHHQLARQFAPIRTTTRELDAVMIEVEARFLEISNLVESTTTTAQELVLNGEGLIALALGQGGGQIIIEATTDHIWHAIEFVERNAVGSDTLIQQLVEADEQIGRTLAAEQALARTLAPLTYVQTLFRVESAGLPAEVQVMFQALAAEIERVRQRVESEFREKFRLIREIKAILDQSIDQLSIRQAHAKRAVAELRDHLKSSLVQMKVAYEAYRDRNTHLNGVSTAIAAETGRMVMSLQFFDAFTQKLQHGRKILEEMENGIATLPPQRGEACRRLRFLQQAGQVCGAQVESMKVELSRSGKDLEAGLHAILEQMKSLDGDCLALRDLDDVTTGVDGAVQILLDSLVDVQRLVREAESFALDAYQAIQPIGGKTTSFTSFIRTLSFEIQLIGLNAELQSAQVGHGTGLEVLSAQMSAISRETSQLSTGLALELDTLTAGLEVIVDAFRKQQDDNVSYNKTLAHEAKTASTGLHDYRDSSLKVLQQLGDLLPRLEEQIHTAKEQVNFVTLTHEPLTKLQTAVAELAVAAQSAADRSGLPVETTGLTDHFFQFYTMKAESEVHRQALGQTAPTAAEQSVVKGDGAVDLFGFDVPVPGGNSANGDVELFGFDEPAVTAPARASVLPPEVELWLDPPAGNAEPNRASSVPGQRDAAN